MTTYDVKIVFEREFGTLKHLFEIYETSVPQILNAQGKYIWHAGVYVFWKNQEVWKVGRHLTNSRKRAWEHIRDDTNFESYHMKDLEFDEEARLLLFNVKDSKHNHWVAALEIFFENELNPKIKSKRLG